MNSIQGTRGGYDAQGVRGHHQHKGMGGKIDDLLSVINDSVKSGKLTKLQGASMAKELSDLKNQLPDLSGQSEDARLSMRDKVRTIARDLMEALKSAENVSQPDGFDKLFAKIDSDKSGKIDKAEFQKFADSYMQNGRQGHDSPATYNGSGSFSMSLSVTQVHISISA